MLTRMIVPDASLEAYGSPKQLNPIIATTIDESGEYLQKEASSSKKASRLEELPSWEYFLNELEFE
ncbi:MAG: hypothetical protein EBZ67_06940 [Chitinophagia bacterium]|nr:hypothetical protein [Chitinophagia bacterium]